VARTHRRPHAAQAELRAHAARRQAAVSTLITGRAAMFAAVEARAVPSRRDACRRG
jgi:hypothetical protein